MTFGFDRGIVALMTCGCMLFGLCAAQAADTPASKPATAPATTRPVLDNASPLSVALVFMDALCEGDLATATRLSVDGGNRETVLASLSAKLHGLVLIEVATSEKFGQPPPRQTGEPSTTARNIFKLLENSPLDVDRSTARIRKVPQPLVLRRSEGQWRVDPRSLYAHVPPEHVDGAAACDVELGETAKAIARDVLAGVYPTFDDVTRATQVRMQAVMMAHKEKMIANARRSKAQGKKTEEAK
jgi:hypothetical protein